MQDYQNMLLLKIYGLTDIISAIVMLFSAFWIPSPLKIMLVLILLFKGIPSIFGDMACKFDAVIDISAALIIVTSFLMPDILKIILALILIAKGLPAML